MLAQSEAQVAGSQTEEGDDLADPCDSSGSFTLACLPGQDLEALDLLL